jgi:hypothetical protein
MEQSALPLMFEFLPSHPVEVEVSHTPLSSDAGLLPIRELDQRLGWTEGFAAQLIDTRKGCEHSLLEMVRQRMFGILAGYEDQNDHDALRSDPIFKMIAGRSPNGNDLASQPTLSRFENGVTAGDLLRLEEYCLHKFITSFATPPTTLTLDIDLFDDPTHGEQQLTFFHGYYNQYQYEVRLITCAENEQIVFPVLLHGTADGRLGLLPDVTRVVRRLRAAFPDVIIRWRGDSGFSGPAVYAGCEAEDLEYTLGLGMNSRLQALSDETLELAVNKYEETQLPQRLFVAFDYQAGSWDQPRWVVVKCECNAQGTNRRAVVTNRRGARVCPAGVYDDYGNRGESENRNKELKCELLGDRLSDHRYLANCFRMFLHVMACNVLVRLRQVVANPPPVPPVDPEMPVEARTPQQKRRRHNERRKADPLGEGQACTWRMMLIKVAATVIVSTRRVRVLLSSTWPYFEFYQTVSAAVLGFLPPAPCSG